MKGRDKRRQVKNRRVKGHGSGVQDCGGRVCGECEACREKIKRLNSVVKEA